MSTYYGSATQCVNDLPLISTQTVDPALMVGQRVARRLTTPRGALALIGDDPNFGYDIRQYINAKLSPAQISSAQSLITAEILKDQQVQSASVVMNFNADGDISLDITLNLGSGPFTLTLNVSQVTSSLVFNFDQ